MDDDTSLIILPASSTAIDDVTSPSFSYNPATRHASRPHGTLQDHHHYHHQRTDTPRRWDTTTLAAIQLESRLQAMADAATAPSLRRRQSALLCFPAQTQATTIQACTARTLIGPVFLCLPRVSVHHRPRRCPRPRPRLRCHRRRRP
ncbi:hypothetical protein BC831DRAFT_157045 [Entophlyctis helioformis]|nr:hypothetical protein BC831DRAFT_157045 [Entophlyctis helioformis]